MSVLDASALLAFLFAERGGSEVERALAAGEVVCSAANWSEVAQKVRAAGRSWGEVKSALRSFGLEVEPVTEADAENAAALWQTRGNFSLADRLCLALGARLGASILTADAEWAGLPGVELIR